MLKYPFLPRFQLIQGRRANRRGQNEVFGRNGTKFPIIRSRTKNETIIVVREKGFFDWMREEAKCFHGEVVRARSISKFIHSKGM